MNRFPGLQSAIIADRLDMLKAEIKREMDQPSCVLPSWRAASQTQQMSYQKDHRLSFGSSPEFLSSTLAELTWGPAIYGTGIAQANDMSGPGSEFMI